MAKNRIYDYTTYHERGFGGSLERPNNAQKSRTA